MFSKKVIATRDAAPFPEMGINFYTVYTIFAGGGGNNGYTVVLGELQLLNVASAGAEDGIGRFLIRNEE